MPPAETRRVHTFCRLCNGLCGIVVEVRGDRVERVTGDRDHPVSHGYTCSKGRALPLLHHHRDRLDRPLARGADGSLREVGWAEALDRLAGRLAEVTGRYGAGAVAAYRASHWAFDCTGRAVSERFFRGLGTAQLYSSVTLDTPSKNLVPDLVAGSPYLFPLPDWAGTRLLLLLGQNPVVSHGHIGARPDPVGALRAIRRRGGAVVVADPRVTETAALADVHLQLRPGSDAALLAHLVREVLDHRPDRSYLAACAEPGSVPALRAAVAPFAASATADRCGLTEDDLRRVRDLVSGAPRLACQTGTGVSMAGSPNVGEWLAWALAAVTGSLDRPGGMVVNPGVLRPQEVAMTTRPRVSGPSPTSRPELPHSYGELPTAALCDEILAGNVRVLFVLGGNPMTTFPDTERTHRALTALDELVVCDVVGTETTALATLVIPVAGQLERADLASVLDTSYPVPFAQYAARVVAPAADRRPMWWFFAALAQRLGLPLPDVVRTAAAAVGTERAEDLLLATAASRSRVPWQILRGSPHGVVDANAPGPGWLVPDRLPRGRLDLCPAELAGQLRDWASRPVEPAGLTLINRRLPRQMNSVLRDVDGQRRPGPRPTVLVHPDDCRRLGLGPGQPVRVVTDHGDGIDAVVEPSHRIRPGAVSVPHGWAAPNVNRLTSADRGAVDPLTGMPRLSGLRVRLFPRP